MIFKNSIKPTLIDLEITNACPADCLMCPRDKLPKIGLMKDETFNNLLNSLKTYKYINHISFSGIGEPLIHPKVFEYIKEIKNVSNHISIGIVTGGEKLTPENFETLKELKVNMIELSIQAVNEDLYNKLMPGLKFKNVIDNINYVSDNLPKDMNFSLNLTVHKLNQHHINEVFAFSKVRGLKLGYRKIHTRSGNLNNKELLDIIDSKKNLELNNCKIFELINFISWNGDIQICCHDVERLYTVGNINKQSLEKVSEIKSQLIFQKKLNTPICIKCDDEFRNLLDYSFKAINK